MFGSFIPQMGGKRSKNVYDSNDFSAGESFTPKFDSGGFKSNNFVSPFGFSSMFGMDPNQENRPMAPPQMPSQSPSMGASMGRAMAPSMGMGIWNPQMMMRNNPMMTNTETGESRDLSQNPNIGGGLGMANRIPGNRGIRY